MCLAALMQYPLVTDRQTDRRSATAYAANTPGDTVAARQITLALIEVGRGTAWQSGDNVA